MMSRIVSEREGILVRGEAGLVRDSTGGWTISAVSWT
jgi:hypothetical protein